ncbi:hypothetical protein KC19_1G009900 [Ceratodon purpureus]|uniref:Uncharacterized protein n=1 Tax=Ceratodon purpureus TaxID=3225 RepID=A0A8T0IZY7_CERPU|nr:hypothetical protein KC19_1G009900 [Ceratodon purpureus]
MRPCTGPSRVPPWAFPYYENGGDEINCWQPSLRCRMEGNSIAGVQAASALVIRHENSLPGGVALRVHWVLLLLPLPLLLALCAVHAGSHSAIFYSGSGRSGVKCS